MGWRGKIYILLLSIFIALPANAGNSLDFIRFIIKEKQPSPQTTLKASIAKTTGMTLPFIMPMADNAFLISFDITGLRLTNTQRSQFIEFIEKRLRQDKNLAYVVEDKVGYFKPVNPPEEMNAPEVVLSHKLQWNEFTRPGGIMLETVPGARDGAWLYTASIIAPTIVAVLDTGVVAHPNLENNILHTPDGKLLGWSFARNNADVSDATGSFHGTHVAGIIAGYGEIAGVSDHLKILPIAIADTDGMFYESAVINAIYWAVGAHIPNIPDNPYPARVLNMSFGIDEFPGKEIEFCDQALQDAIDFAAKQGAIIIAAAGNDNRDANFSAPAACKGVITVAATGPEGLRSYYSNYGPNVTLAAPGGDLRYGPGGGILSTVHPQRGYLNSGFDFHQGTSMAAPHVSGVAGLLFSLAASDITPEVISKIIIGSTHHFGTTKNATYACTGEKPCGTGILDADHAVKALLNLASTD